MRWSIFTKLFVAFIVISLIVFASISVLINSSFRSGFQNYVNANEIKQVESLATSAASLYQQYGSWKPVRQNPRVWANLMLQLGEAPPPMHKPLPPRQKDKQEFSPLSFRVNLLNQIKKPILGRLENLHDLQSDSDLVFVEVKVDEKIVGWITVKQNKEISQPLAESFLQHQMKQVYAILLIGFGGSFVFALMLAKIGLRPLKNLQEGTKALIKGDLDHTITSSSRDEFDDLVAAFNQLSQTLKTQKQLRDQWLSDISHELRTPLAVLKSEIEAIQDGIRQPEPKFIDSLHNQVTNLTKLVNDLNTLSRATSGLDIKLDQSVDYQQILQQQVNQNSLRFEDKSLRLSFESQLQEKPVSMGDPKALTQVFSNLLENSYRYTNSDGQVLVVLSASDRKVNITIEDSAPNVPKDSLAKLFERLYRVDQSRSRSHGGSGLGLAICQQIIAAHGGTINAEQSSLGGISMVIELPMLPESH